MLDSNQRRHKPADLQSAPFGRSGNPPYFLAILVKSCAPPKCLMRLWRGSCGEQENGPRTARGGRGGELTTGFEPATACLQNRCSTVELRQRRAAAASGRRERLTDRPNRPDSGSIRVPVHAAEHATRQRNTLARAKGARYVRAGPRAVKLDPQGGGWAGPNRASSGHSDGDAGCGRGSASSVPAPSRSIASGRSVPNRSPLACSRSARVRSAHAVRTPVRSTIISVSSQ